jgi:hypothetical protein
LFPRYANANPNFYRLELILMMAVAASNPSAKPGFASKLTGQ